VEKEGNEGNKEEEMRDGKKEGAPPRSTLDASPTENQRESGLQSSAGEKEEIGQP